jgi:hypothetical protein
MEEGLAFWGTAAKISPKVMWETRRSCPAPISGAISAVALFFFARPVITPYWRRLRCTPAPARQET